MAQNIGSSTALAAGPATADKLTAMRHGPMSVVLTTDPVSITPDSPGCHEHYEFFLPINVMQKLFIEDCSIDCHPGQIVPINPGQLHGFRHGNRAVSFILLQFETAYLSNLVSEMLPADAVAAAGWPPAFENAPFAISPEIQALGAYIIREFDERHPGRDRLIPSLTEVLAIMLVRTCFSKMSVAAPARQVLQSERYLRFRQVIEHMQNHLAEKISIDNLAEIAGMNRFPFHTHVQVSLFAKSLRLPHRPAHRAGFAAVAGE